MEDYGHQWGSKAIAKETFDLTGSVLNITAVIRDIAYTTYGLDVQVFQAMQFILNFTHFIQKENEWGTYNGSTGESTGMMRRILDHEVDLAYTASAIIPALHDVLDFTMTTYTLSYAAMFQKQTFLGNSLALLRPFHWSLWLAVGLWCACVYCAFGSAAYLSQLLMRTRIHRDNHSSILPFSLLCGKSLPCSMLATAWCRLIVYTGTMSAMLLNAGYSAVLLSFLFIPQDSSNLSQLKSLGQFEFLVHPGNVFLFEQKLKGAQPSEFLNLYSSHNKVLGSIDKRSSKVKILGGHWVHLAGEWATYECLTGCFDPSEKCSVTMALLPIGKQQWGCMVPKQSKYKRSLDYSILKTREKGLLTLWRKRFAPQRPSCPSGGKYEAVP